MLANRKFSDVVRGQSARIRSKWRKAITGDETKRIRDHLQEVPSYVKLMDKIAFTLGLLNILAVEYFLLKLPNYFWVWYVLIVPILLLTRAVLFRSRGWQYFMLDFCYFTLGCTLLNLLILWDSMLFFKVVFIYTNGPLTWAIVIWRNSLVFHDYDKITSVYIHLLPSILYYAGRWHGHSSVLYLDKTSLAQCALVTNNPPPHCIPDDSIGATEFIVAALGYLIWQACYFVKTEIADKAKLDSRPELLTSLRWLSSDTKNAFAKAVLKICRRLGILRPDEMFNSRENKTKIVFISTQFLYTVITFLPTPLLYRSPTLHVFYLIFIFTAAAFYGAGFYIEVFSRTYALQFRKQSELERVAEAAAEVAYEVATSAKHRDSKATATAAVIDATRTDRDSQAPVEISPVQVQQRVASVTRDVGKKGGDGVGGPGSPVTVTLLRDGARRDPRHIPSFKATSSLPEETSNSRRTTRDGIFVDDTSSVEEEEEEGNEENEEKAMATLVEEFDVMPTDGDGDDEVALLDGYSQPD